MSQILLPGNNTVVLCGAAVQQIVQEHLRCALYGGRDEAKPRVTGVKYDSSNHTFAFEVKTDQEKAA
jgi:hypothetical protein